MKDDDGRWNTAGHASRLLTVTERELAIMAQIEDTTDVLGTKLLAAHSTEALSVLEKLSKQPRRAADVDPNYSVSSCFHETNDQNKGYFVKAPAAPATIDNIVICGPNIQIGNPGGQSSGPEAKTNLDYVATDWAAVPNDFVPNAKYRVTEKGREAVAVSAGSSIRQTTLICRGYVSITGNRTVMPVLLPKFGFHVDSMTSHSMQSSEVLATTAGLASSILVDFSFRTMGSPRIFDLLKLIPFPAADSPWLYPLAMVALRMNCVTSHYAPLWEEVTAHYGIKSEWSREHAPRTDSARRMSSAPSTPRSSPSSRATSAATATTQAAGCSREPCSASRLN